MFAEENEDVFELQYMKDIHEQCRQTANYTLGNRDNPFYQPKISEHLFKLSELLLIWSAIMIPIFGFGSITQYSTASESLFKEMKKDASQHEKIPMRVDEFVEKHLNHNRSPL